jgi:hypothetical protein
MSGLHQNPSNKTSIHLLSNDLTPLFNKFWDKVQNIVIKENYNCNPNYIRFVFKAKRPVV